MLTRHDFYTYEDLEELGLGSRMTIIRGVKSGNFPPPRTFSMSPNAVRLWEKELIHNYMKQFMPRDKWRERFMQKRVGDWHE
jgi:hypothetical protein|tara:strand:+ start:260 stop:505 length:246 start_codon:yes stop_codon:yes gene_type:complete